MQSVQRVEGPCLKIGFLLGNSKPKIPVCKSPPKGYGFTEKFQELNIIQRQIM